MSGNYPPGPPSNQPGGNQPGGNPPGGGQPRGPQYQGPGGGPYQGGPQGPGQQPYGQPSGPPPGYPTGGQQPYGGQQQPYPGYGQGQQGPQGPQRPQGPGGPGGPGQPPNQPYQQPPQKKGGVPVIPIIIGVVVLALIAGAIAIGVALTRKSPTTGGTPGGGGSNPAPSSSSAPPANVTKASDAVQAYLEALAKNDAAAAIALSDTAPSDETFLTNEVLQASSKIAPITDIKVPVVDDEYAYSVSASFKLGKQQVDEDFSVTKAGDTWKLREAFNDIDFSTRGKGFPTIINGVQAKTTKIRLFPGAYEFTTGSENVSWGEDNVLIVQSPSDYPSGLTDLKPTLTDKGAKAFTAAVKASLANCLKSDKLTNPGCPNSIDPKRLDSSYKIKDGTLKWEASRADSLDDSDIRLDYSKPSVASAIVSFGLTATADCNAYSGKCTVYPYSSLYPKADMLASTIKVSWGSI